MYKRQDLFRKKRIYKTYLAIVVGKPNKKRGIIDLPIYNHEDKSKKPAKTSYEIIDNLGKELSFLALYPETGRKHQLRIHLKEIGHPILGDGKYGGRNAFIRNLSNKIHLHAFEIQIDNYYGKKLKLSDPIEENFKQTMDELGFSEMLL